MAWGGHIILPMCFCFEKIALARLKAMGGGAAVERHHSFRRELAAQVQSWWRADGRGWGAEVPGDGADGAYHDVEHGARRGVGTPGSRQAVFQADGGVITSPGSTD